MVVALLAAAAGLALMIWSVVEHRSRQRRTLDEFLGSAPGHAPGTDDEEIRGIAEWAVGVAARIVERVDQRRSLRQSLDRARIAVRPGEFLILVGAGGLGTAAVLYAIAGTPAVALAGPVTTTLFAAHLVRRRIAKRARAFEEQLPDALALIASSLSAGHTFLRAIQMMCEESAPPLSEEFTRVLAETRLGDPVVNALERLAQRIQVRDMDIVVQAIRIQQTVGGRLADLLQTLSEFIRARAEVRREVKVLTAEGRMSAYVLAGLVPFLVLVIQVINPSYIGALYHGWGLVLLGGCGVSVLIGMFIILRLVRIDI